MNSNSNSKFHFGQGNKFKNKQRYTISTMKEDIF